MDSGPVSRRKSVFITCICTGDLHEIWGPGDWSFLYLLVLQQDIGVDKDGDTLCEEINVWTNNACCGQIKSLIMMGSGSKQPSKDEWQRPPLWGSSACLWRTWLGPLWELRASISFCLQGETRGREERQEGRRRSERPWFWGSAKHCLLECHSEPQHGLQAEDPSFRTFSTHRQCSSSKGHANQDLTIRSLCLQFLYKDAVVFFWDISTLERNYISNEILERLNFPSGGFCLLACVQQ